MRILVIEDDPSVHELLLQGLGEEGFVVDIATDGERGSYIARTDFYDLILLDIGLPKKSGYEVCTEIRQSGRTTPIIMISVQSEVPLKVDLLECGADDFITKPFSIKEVAARVRAVLRRPPILEKHTLCIADVIICPQKQLATRNGKTIYLTRKEFLLLEYLIKNKGIVVSRSMIMEHVWNMDTDPFSNTIEAHILNLRKKVDIGRKIKLIHAIPGRGYKMDLEA